MAKQNEIDDARASLTKSLEGKLLRSEKSYVQVDARAVHILASSVKTPTQKSGDLAKGTEPPTLAVQRTRWHAQDVARVSFIYLDQAFWLLDQETVANDVAVIPE